MSPESEVIALPGRPARTPKPQFLSALAERTLRARLARITDGALLIEHEGSISRYGPAGAERPVSLRIHDRRFWTEVAFGGSIGAGESYMQGDWSTDDLTGLVRLMLRNRDVLDGVDGSLSRITAPLQKLLHAASRNTRSGSRRNIAAHYDLGNDFFALFLDPTMMYSSALFEHDAMTLEEASIAKLDRICRKLDLRPGQRVLEIGTGWGGFALHAASRYGCHVTTTTLSREQHDLAAGRIARAGLSGRVTLLLEDYRDLAVPEAGGYDRLVSIEMIEAVGHRYYDEYFSRCSALLAQDGMMMLQAITIADQRYEQALRSVDFIQRHIFPGSCIPSVSAIAGSVARATDMKLYDLTDIGLHYARTLAAWRTNLAQNRAQVLALGYSEAFLRLWEFYFCYCEGGFAERALGDVQMLLVKPGARPA
jgi:cyclopropane-fatty-acyl-phospholipid synthase